jgi:hypothetical protein
MNKLAKLFQAVEFFYKKAVQLPDLIKNAAPGDPYEDYDDIPEGEDEPTWMKEQNKYDKYQKKDNDSSLSIPQKLRNLDKLIVNSDIGNGLLSIAKMFEAATNMNTGFMGLLNFVLDFKNSHSSEFKDESNSEQIEQTLNECINYLSKIVENNYPGDSPDSIEMFHNIVNETISSSLSDANKTEEELKRDADKDLQDQQKEILGDGGDDEGGPSELPTFDPSMLSSKKQDKGDKGTSLHIEDKKEPKDWIFYYEVELQSYNNQLKFEKDPQIQQRISAVISNIQNLIKVYNEQKKLYAGDDNEQTKVALIENKKQVSQLKIDLAKSKAVIRKKSLDDKFIQIERKLNSTSDKNSHEAYVLKQEKEYLDLIRNTDSVLGKREESALRRDFVNRLKAPATFNSPGGYRGKIDPITGKRFFPEELAIAEAAKKRVSRTQYNKMKWQAQLALLRSGTFKGLILDFSKKILNHKASVKKDVVDDSIKVVQAARYNELKPYIDAATAAKKSKNKAAIDAAAAALNEAMNKKELNAEAERDVFVKEAVDRSNKFRQLRDLLDELEKLSSSENPEDSSKLVSDIVDMAKKLVSQNKGKKYTISLVTSTEELIKLLETGAIK